MTHHHTHNNSHDSDGDDSLNKKTSPTTMSCLYPSTIIPRLCHLQKWPDFDGYGFNLHADKSRAGQFVGKVDDGSPAEAAGLKEGDRIIEVNGVNIANENHRQVRLCHETLIMTLFFFWPPFVYNCVTVYSTLLRLEKQVVERIKAIPNETRLLVLDEESDVWCRTHGVVVRGGDPTVQVIRSNDNREGNKRQETVEAVVIHEQTPVASSTTTTANNHEEGEQPGADILSEDNSVVEESVVILGGKEVPVDVPSSSSSSLETTDNSIAVQESPSPSSFINNNHLKNNNHSSSVDDDQEMNEDDKGRRVSSSSSGLEEALQMSVQEVRRLLQQKKKHDPKKIPMDLKQKYDIISSM